MYLFSTLAFLFRLFLPGVLASYYYTFEWAFLNCQADNQEVHHFLFSLVHPFNGLIQQHTTENGPKPLTVSVQATHGITLTKKLCYFKYICS